MSEPDKQTNRPLMVFDGDCGFCRIWIDYWQRLTGERVAYAPFQEVADRFPQISLEHFQEAVQLVLPDGRVVSAARAVFTSLSYSPGRKWLLWLYEHIPGFASVSEWAYRLIAAHRDFFYQVTRVLWGARLEPATHSLVTWLFLRALGLIYLIAFASFGVQVLGLIGSNGILPASDFLQAVHNFFGSRAYSFVPTVFWLHSSHPALQIAWLLGAVLAVAPFLGFLERP